MNDRNILGNQSDRNNLQIKNCARVKPIPDILMAGADGFGAMEAKAEPYSEICVVGKLRCPCLAVCGFPCVF